MPDPCDVERAVRDLTLTELLRLLAPWDHEWLCCPRCSTLMKPVDVTIVSAFVWRCGGRLDTKSRTVSELPNYERGASNGGTLWSTRSLVLATSTAIDRLVTQ
ncbi:hypothetical protein HC251_14200 [Iamia sp. SCSIO 61187]|uniref:hypothetical protein n=1 Tax=Iamia sp. SCSIO 61187 TaxID=2722752 RepID=UPI001C62E888|nr:hypothetical protein [Iamia sp. SCSIO 61187]QYG93460.1 hypothetical protein HC251_14200 [Iamia sp. SCSIO 61187]